MCILREVSDIPRCKDCNDIAHLLTERAMESAMNSGVQAVMDTLGLRRAESVMGPVYVKPAEVRVLMTR